MWFGSNCYIIFVLLFTHCELSHFSPLIYIQWEPLVSTTPLTVFVPIVLKRCFVFLWH